ncbi:DUF3175 domain-containing protein [Candidatus Parcubacteria bacterium]|nr:MAG: DUF3175 domain-containing protein [Candidatus Parcubacteria bacterium]
METSDVLDLAHDVCSWNNPARIGRSLAESALRSTRSKALPFRRALSILVFYINRRRPKSSPERKRALEAAKDELRCLFGRPPKAHCASRTIARARHTRANPPLRNSPMRKTLKGR